MAGNRRRKTSREELEPLAPDERDARAAAMLARRLAGDWKGEIAQAFQLTMAEVNNELDYARRKALHTRALDFITVTLMPKALGVYAAALEEGNVEVATKVLEGLGVIGKQGGISLTMSTNDGGQDSFESWRMKISRAATGPENASAASVDVEVMRGGSQSAGTSSGVAGGSVEGPHRAGTVDAEVLSPGGSEDDREGDGEGAQL
jgi:hypothetical protein